MKLIVAGLVEPPAQLRGYLQRYLMEPLAGHFVGGGTREICEDIRNSLCKYAARGFLATSNFKRESGFEFLYFKMANDRLLDLDGLQWIEHFKSNHQERHLNQQDKA